MKSPIFIIGSPRSGTTMLRLMLTCHHNIVIPPECGFAVWWYNKYINWDPAPSEDKINLFLEDLFSSKKFDSWCLDKVELRQYLLQKTLGNYSVLISSIYEFFAQRQNHTFKRWGDKNNFYLNHIEILFQLFPEGQFIHIVRDGRDIACSYRELEKMKFNSKYSPELPTEIAEIASQWRDNIRKIRKSFETIGWGKAIEIRYEDLVMRPDAILIDVCKFLEEEYDPLMLQFHRINREKELEPREFLSWKIKTLDQVTDSEVLKYKKCLSEDEQEIFAGIAAAELALYNYKHI